MNVTSIQQYSNTYPIRYVVKPRQPIIGKKVLGSVETIFTYDIIAPYGMGATGVAPVSNSAQDTLTMPGWGMIVHMALLAPGVATLTIQVDLHDGTFTEIDTSPVAIAANAKVQTFDIKVLPCFKIRGRLAGDGASTYTYHVSLTDY